MKYMLIMTGTKTEFEAFTKWPKEDLQANVAFMRAFSKELKDAGVFVSAQGLAWPDQARLVRAGSDGEPITDGVFPESKEFLAGYWIIDVASAEQAYKFAARASMAPGRGGVRGGMPVEVRPVIEHAPEELLR